jgi:hypothetical protein
MKKAIIAVTLVVGVVLAVMAADPRGRVDTRLLAGTKNFVQDEMDRENVPRFLTTGTTTYNITNQAWGVIVVVTNATSLTHIGLPNPTNNYGRRFFVTPNGAATLVLTNMSQTGSFTSNNAPSGVHASYFVQSNKTALAFSTGTNYYVRDF